MATSKPARKSKPRAPWKKPAPKGTRKTTLTPASRRKAKASAHRAGRPYPSLVDNMNAAKKQKAGAGRAKKSRSR
jgi:hypothetical protein